MEKRPSVDEILMEIGTSKPQPSSTSLDVDALLDSILKEKRVTPQQPSPDELPTKVFRRARKRTEEHTTERAAKQPAAPKKREQTAPKKTEVTGPILIDVDAIRAKQPAPKMTPAQLFDDERPQKKEADEKPQKEIRFHQRKEEDDEFSSPLTPTPFFASVLSHNGTDELHQWLPLLEKWHRMLSLRAILLAVCTVFTLVLTLMIQSSKGDTALPSYGMLIGLAAIGLLAGVIGFEVLKSAARSMLRLQPNRDILPATAYIACLLQSLVLVIFRDGLLRPDVHLYLAVGVLSLTVGIFAHRTQVTTALKNIKFVIDDNHKEVPNIIRDGRAAGEFTRGTVEGLAIPAINQPIDLLEDFLLCSFASDSSDRLSRNLGFTGIIAGAVAWLFALLFTRSMHMALTVGTAVVIVFTPLTNLFTTAFPLRRAASLNRRVGGLTTGERSMEEFGHINALLMDAKKLFPPSFIVLNGIKTFEGMRIDEAILDAASLLIKANSILSDIFLNIIGSRNDLLRPVDQMEYEDGLGLSAWVGNHRVLIGNRELMAHHGIRVPSLDYESRFTSEGSDLVYLATSGELTAVFVITLHPSALVEDAIHMLEDNDIFLSIRTTDSIISKERLTELFGTYRDYFKIIPKRLHERFAEEAGRVKVKSAVLANDGGLVSTACTLSITKRIRMIISTGRVIQTVSIVIGCLLVLSMALLGAFAEITPLVLGAYLLIWLIIDILIQWFIQI